MTVISKQKVGSCSEGRTRPAGAGAGGCGFQFSPVPSPRKKEGKGEDNFVGRPAVIPFDGFCSVTPSYLANLLVEKNVHPSFLLAVLWPLMEIHLYPTVIDSL
jgi:hypothetical protein